MSEVPPLIILLAAVLTNNILLSNFLGLCSFLACSKQMETAVGLGVAVIFVTFCTTVINYLINYGLLVPLHLEHLQFIIFIAVIAAFTQLVEMIVERFSPTLYYHLGIFLPLIAVNCVILAACLFMVLRSYGFWQSVAWGLGAPVGWTLAICLMSGIQQRLRFSNVPKPLAGLAITMITTGLMALAFMGFAGMAKIQ